MSRDPERATAPKARTLLLQQLDPSSVTLDHVSKRYDDVVALDELTLEARAGEFLVLLGPSGCGKTTVLRLVAGLESPTAGLVKIGERTVNDVAPKDRDVAMVFQSYALYPHLSVLKNIEFPLRSRGVAAPERSSLVAEVARSLRLDQLLARKPAQLSGGQRQRVALARAIVRRPRAFLMDEPLSNLDAQLRVEMRAELVQMHSQLGITVLYVTHDQIEAMTMGDRVAVLRDGVLQQLDAPAVVHASPANAFVAGFIGSPPMNILSGTLETDGEAAFVSVPGGRISVSETISGALRHRGLRDVVIGLRPEELEIRQDGEFDAVVTLVELVGHEEHVGCRLPGGQLIWVRRPANSPALRSGANVSVSAIADPHLFDPVTTERIDA